MSDATTLLFLHGVGSGDPDDLWKARLSMTLRSVGYPGLDDVHVLAPKYVNALKAADKEALPPITIKQPSRDEARDNRRSFERRIGALELRLGRHNGGDGGPLNDVLVDLSVAGKFFRQANNYINDANVRARVLHRVMGTLPRSGRLVIIGHSLGSVIAADLVRRLPAGLDVAGMVTIGSPLANGSFDVEKLSESLKEPPANLAWWANFWSPFDPVAARRGASSTFPWILDLRTAGGFGVHAHDAVEYLADDAVATAIGFGLFGSRSKEIERIELGADVPLDLPGQYALLALRYAALVNSHLDGDLKDRHAGAMRRVQAATVQDFFDRDAAARRSTPAAIAHLAFDVTDASAELPETLPAQHLAKEDAVAFLTVLATENVIRPFEIDVHRDVLKGAMQDLSAEMGLGGKYGADVFEALKRSREVLQAKKINLLKFGMIGAGAVAVIVATGGLALGATAGLAGAAAITSALAAFGPGGMIGGLVTAGTLIGAGGGSLAFGLASPTVSAAALESVIERQLTAVILRQLQHLEQDPSVWQSFTAIELEVRRQHERLDEFSDPTAPGLTDLKRKITAVERALKYMEDNGLAPLSTVEEGGTTNWTD